MYRSPPRRYECRRPEKMPLDTKIFLAEIERLLRGAAATPHHCDTPPAGQADERGCARLWPLTATGISPCGPVKPAAVLLYAGKAIVAFVRLRTSGLK
ncbi:MAG: hypothetical protein WD060_00150 [Pirellulales bacterium]